MDAVSPHPSVFIGYSHDDEAWKDHLVPLLRVFTLEEELEVWDDRWISGGIDWLPEIEAALTRARIAVFLISNDFLSSSLSNRTEIQDRLQRRQADGLTRV